MFCTLALITTKKRFCKNLKIEEKNIGNIKFIKAVIHKKSSLKKFEKRLKGKIDTVIISDNLKGITFDSFKIYNNTDYLKNIAIFTFIRIIKLSEISPNKLKICISDKECNFPSVLSYLANYASIINVLTDNKEKYNLYCEKIFEEHGMQPILSDCCNNANLGLDFDNEYPQIWFNNPSNNVVINEKCVKIGPGLKSFVPNGINECDFAGVLQNYNDFKRLKLLNADLMEINNNYFKINKDNIKNLLDINTDC